MAKLIVELDANDIQVLANTKGDAPTKNPFVDPHDDEWLVRCPYCGQHAYSHLGSVETNQNGFVVEITQDGPSCRRGPAGFARGSIVYVNYWCECGHRFRHAFKFHKGQTFASVEPLGAFDLDQDAVHSLWRD